jgi:hypothetical protein
VLVVEYNGQVGSTGITVTYESKWRLGRRGVGGGENNL